MNQKLNPLQIFLIVLMAAVVLAIIGLAISLFRNASTNPLDIDEPISTLDADTQTSLPIVTPEPTPIPPRIESFNGSFEIIDTGTCVELSWNISGEVTSIRVQRDGLSLPITSSPEAAIEDCPEGPGVVSYRLQAWDIAGASDTAELSITVLTPTSTPDSPLFGSWLLTFYLDPAGKYLGSQEGVDKTANIDYSGNVSGFAGCNQYTALYTTHNEQEITISSLSRTREICDDLIMENEEIYLSLLLSAANFQLTNGWLEIFDANGVKILVFTPAP